MPLALYYKPSYLRLANKISAIAPNLDVAVYDDNGEITLNGKAVSLSEIKPEYFWIHSELLVSERLKDYFRIMLESDSIKWLHTVHTGLDGLPYLDVLRKGVKLTNNHAQAIAIAEFAIGQVLAHFQHVSLFKERQAQGVWRGKRFREVYGSRWTIVGFGCIGQELAKRAKAFGAHITAVRRLPDAAGLADQVVTLSQLGDVLPDTDVLVLACGSNEATREFMGADQFRLMQSSAVLVNVGRGDLLVEDDLHSALDKDELGYAILDVLNEEPPAAESWVWQHQKVSLTPHTSNAGSGMSKRAEENFLVNLERKLLGETLLNNVSERDIV